MAKKILTDAPINKHEWSHYEEDTVFKDNYTKFNVTTDPSNCKLSYINSIGNLANYNSNEDKKDILNQLLAKCKGCVILNTTNINIANFIKNNYKTYYFNEIPIGYGAGLHYHICIKNDIHPNHNCKEPKPLQVGLKPAEVKTKLLATLKTKRRKDDYVDEFIKSLE